jgi:hypothetical protein
MVEYLIGNFMLDSGLMTKEEFDRVIGIQDRVRVKLGLLAVEEGLMTVRQADEVNFLQTVKDKRFGDIAVEKGFLTEEQVDELLKKQGNEYLSFVQTLVDEEIIGIGEMDAVIQGYQIENGFQDDQMEVIRQADVDGILKLFMPEDADAYYDLALLAIKMVIRCIDRHAYFGRPYLTDSYDAVMPVLQKLDGERILGTGIADVNGGMCRAASIFGRYELPELDEDVQDACGEILNCINGLYVSMLSENNIEMEMVPPEFRSNCNISASKIFVMPIYIADKAFDFIITENERR